MPIRFADKGNLRRERRALLGLNSGHFRTDRAWLGAPLSINRIGTVSWLLRIVAGALPRRCPVESLGPQTIGPQIPFPAAWILALLLAGTMAAHAAQAAPRVSVHRVAGLTNAVKAQCGPDGTIHLLYDAEHSPLYAHSQDGGVTFNPPVAVVDAAARRPGLKFSGEDLAVDPDGRVHVALSNNAWKLKLPQEEWGFHYAYLARGATAFTPVRNINRKPSEGFSLAAGRDGTVTASFLSGKLFTMTSRDGGDSFSGWSELNPAWNPCDCCTTSTARGADGRMALLYREETGDERDLHMALWYPQRETAPSRTRISGTPWKIAGCPMTYFALTATGTGYLAAWPTQGRIYFSRLDLDGAVLPPGEIATPGSSGMRSGVLALAAADGFTLVGWKHHENLGWQLYDGKGQAQGPPGLTPSHGHGAAGAVLPDGRFVLFP